MHESCDVKGVLSANLVSIGPCVSQMSSFMQLTVWKTFDIRDDGHCFLWTLWALINDLQEGFSSHDELEAAAFISDVRHCLATTVILI